MQKISLQRDVLPKPRNLKIFLLSWEDLEGEEEGEGAVHQGSVGDKSFNELGISWVREA